MDMLLAVLALTILAAGVVVAAGWLVGGRRRDPGGWLDAATRRRLLVHTRDGQTLDGQLVRVDRDGVVLEPARLDGVSDGLDGQVWVPRERIAWAQQPTGSEPT